MIEGKRFQARSSCASLKLYASVPPDCLRSDAATRIRIFFCDILNVLWKATTSARYLLGGRRRRARRASFHVTRNGQPHFLHAVRAARTQVVCICRQHFSTCSRARSQCPTEQAVCKDRRVFTRSVVCNVYFFSHEGTRTRGDPCATMRHPVALTRRHQKDTRQKRRVLQWVHWTQRCQAPKRDSPFHTVVSICDVGPAPGTQAWSPLD